VKIKRQRMASQISLQLTNNEGDTLSSNDDSTDEDATQVDLSFVADSPVKAPTGSKSFLSLFNENPNNRSDKPGGSKRTLSRSNTGVGIFDRATSVLSDDDVDTPGVFGTRVTQKAKLKVPAENAHSQELSITKGIVYNGTDTRKRSLLVSELEDASVTQPQVPLLIPPSPPPMSSARSNNRYDMKAKAKAAGPSSRKKLKLSVNQDEGEDENSEEEKVKVIDWRSSRRKDNEEQELWKDDEPLLMHWVPHSEEIPIVNSNETEGDFKVDVPQELLQVLAISPSKSERTQDDHIVRALLRGTRAGHYDGNRGGHIWDVGETERDETESADMWRGEGEVVHGSNVVGEDDEWEGEAVSWQVAEL
jgi:hypothetical protein